MTSRKAIMTAIIGSISFMISFNGVSEMADVTNNRGP